MRIEGRKSKDGKHYLLVQDDVVLQTIPIHEAMTDEKLARAIDRNSWEKL